MLLKKTASISKLLKKLHPSFRTKIIRMIKLLVLVKLFKQNCKTASFVYNQKIRMFKLLVLAMSKVADIM